MKYLDKYLLDIYKHIQNKSSLYILVSKILNVPIEEITKSLSELFKNKSTDEKIVKKLRSMKNKFNTKASEYKDKPRYYIIKKGFQLYNKKVTSYIDFGGGNCKAIEELNKKYNLPECYCADIDEWVEDKKLKRSESNYKFLNVSDGKIKLPDNSIDVISVFHVLHHIPNYMQSLTEITRVLKQNGILIIREHDNDNKSTSKLIDLEHFLWAVVNNNLNITEYTKTYYGKYFSEIKIKNILNKDFKYKLIFKTKPSGITKSFYHVYQLID